MSKRKKQEKQKDFQKKKLRVGKTNVKADTHTNTSFTAKTIVLKQQSIFEDKSQEYTTSRNLTLKDLLNQAKHHNPHSRKEAILGLLELLASHPDAFRHRHHLCLETISKLLIDHEKQVRKQLLQFLQEYFELLDEREFKPFMSVFMAYMYSALNHILDDIRLDAFKFLKITVASFDSEMFVPYYDKIIPSFLGVLSSTQSSLSTKSAIAKSNQTSSNLVVSNPSSQLYSVSNRMEMLSLFHEILENGIDVFSDSLWYFHVSGQTKESKNVLSSTFLAESDDHPIIPAAPYIHLAHNDGLDETEFVSIFHPAKRQAIQQSNKTSMTSQNTSNVAQSKPSMDLNSKTTISYLIDQIFPTLVDFWIEAYPNTFSVGKVTMNANMQVLVNILDLTSLMLRSFFILPNEKDDKAAGECVLNAEFVKAIERHILPHFPFGNTFMLSSKDKELDLSIQRLNMLIADILCHLLYSRSLKDKDEHVIKLLLSYLGGLFGDVLADETPQSTIVIPSEILDMVFPTLWSIMSNPTHFINQSKESSKKFTALFALIMSYFTKLPYTTHTATRLSKSSLFHFIKRVVMMQQDKSMGSELDLFADDVTVSSFHKMVAKLPVYLSKLGSSDPELSHSVLEFISFVFRMNVANVRSLSMTLRKTFDAVMCKNEEGTASVVDSYDDELKLKVNDCFYYVKNE